jgi:hypothetical protein
MLVTCPRCGDKFPQSLPDVYRSGSYAMRAYGVCRRECQETLAKLAAPPRKAHTGWKYLLLLLLMGVQGGLVASAVNRTHTAEARVAYADMQTAAAVNEPAESGQTDSRISAVLYLALLVAGDVAGIAILVESICASAVHNQTRWVAAMASWHASFYCGECGQIFLP